MLTGLLTAPLRMTAASARLVLNATVSAASVTIGTTLFAGETAGNVGAAVAGLAPDVGALARAVAGVVLEAAGGSPTRRVSANGLRRWVEVRGLHNTDGESIGDAVVTAVRATPGVREAILIAAISRVCVTVDPDGPSVAQLCGVVAHAERNAGVRDSGTVGVSLPGDDVVLLERALAAVAAVAGIGLALTGGMLRLQVPSVVAVPVALFEQTPRLRREIELKIGAEATDLLFAVVNSTTAALTASPVSAVSEAAARAMLVTEAWNARQAWQQREAEFDCGSPGGARRLIRGDGTEREGSADRYANRVEAFGVAAAAVLGLFTHNLGLAGDAALVAVPRPVRASREALGCALTRGLNIRHSALVMQPHALRILDRVDTVVIDPRALYTDELMISRIRGVTNSHRVPAWEAARAMLNTDGLPAGWHPLNGMAGAGKVGEALVSPVRDPYASALVAEARRAAPRVVSIDDDGLRSLAEGFDHLHRIEGSLDDALAATVDASAAEGGTVVLITTPQMQTPHAADLTIGVLRNNQSPPWGADVFVSDLTGAWRVLRSLPASRRARDKAVQLSESMSLIGAVMLVPGVVGRESASASAGAAAALWNGYSAGAKLFRDPLPQPEPGHDWHALPAEEVRRLLPRTADEPRAPRRKQTGGSRAQRLSHVAVDSWQAVCDFAVELRADLDDPLTPLLVTGAVASALLGSPLDAALVSSVLVANAAISAGQQLHAEHVLDRLLAIQEPPARRCLGHIAERRHEMLKADRLRPGDIIEVRGGEVIPADARLFEASNIEVDESSLTGESLPVAKNATPTPGVPLADRSCMLYGGSTMLAGTGFAVVTAVGSGMEMRRAMAMAPRRSREVGLQAQLQHITKRALPVSVAGGALVGVLSVLRATPLRDSLASAVSVMVAAVPEGLPLVATLAQLAAARKLSDKFVLVRNPHSVEALARLDVVCFDKTGTLSENRLTIKSVRPLANCTRAQVLDTAARTTFARRGHRAEHATDEAIRVAADAACVPGCDDREAFLPFQSGRPFAAALHGTVISVKGSPEMITSVLAHGHDPFTSLVEEMSAAGLRVLAVAERRVDADHAVAAAADPAVLEELCRGGLSPVGLLGLADTPRAAAGALLTELTHRGIGVRLITGDHPVTAKAVATELGLAVSAAQVLTGSQWEALSVAQRAEAVTTCTVFARMTPEHKIDVVQTLERIGMVTAMVGDGANDAAAIRAATVGVGVVSRGSDPARNAADIMLLDGRIEALLDAIDEGHQLWRRVHSAVSVLLGGNAGEIAFALVTTLLTGDSALNTRQMLLVNLLTDALPAAALAVSDQNASGASYHDEAALWREIGLRGVATTGGATLAWLLARPTGTARHAASVALIGLVGTQLMQTLVDSNSPAVVLTSVGSFAVMGGVISTPVLSQLFGCTPVSPTGWAQGLFAAGSATALSAFAPGLMSRIEELWNQHFPSTRAHVAEALRVLEVLPQAAAPRADKSAPRLMS